MKVNVIQEYIFIATHDIVTEMCEYLADAIAMIRKGPLWQYIPNCSWHILQRDFGASHSFAHLLTEPSPSTDVANSHSLSGPSIRGIISQILDIELEDVSPEAPLTSYGLDSLSAIALSQALAPRVAITQLQLLSDVTLADLEELEEQPNVMLAQGRF